MAAAANAASTGRPARRGTSAQRRYVTRSTSTVPSPQVSSPGSASAATSPAQSPPMTHNSLAAGAVSSPPATKQILLRPRPHVRSMSGSAINSGVAVPSSSSSSTSSGVWHVLLSEGVWICALIFGGCCSNVIALEMTFRQIPKSASLLTFMQFMFVTVEGVAIGGFVRAERIFTVHPSLRGYIPKEVVTKSSSSLPFRLSLKPCAIPIKHWMLMAVMFWSLSTMNNLALDYQIDMPLHILFKSGGLLLNMLLGYALMRKHYSLTQLLSVTMITLGVAVATYASARSLRHESRPSVPLHQWLTGILLLATSLLISSLLGLYQEYTYRRYGKQWREGLFYTHFLGLPLFAFLWRDIVHQTWQVATSSHVSVADLFAVSSTLTSIADSFVPSVILTLSIPKLVLLLGANALTQFLCISGVHQLTTVATSLTVNLVLTFRKFVSLLISVYFFDADFGVGHWIGTALVFVGTLIYSAVSTRRQAMSHQHHHPHHTTSNRVRLPSGRLR